MAGATSHRNTLRAVGVAALVVACGLGYANALDAAFVYDDLVNIVQRASLRWEQLSLRSWVAATVDSPSRRPTAVLTFGLQYWSGWDSARAFHAVNVFIHLLNGLLVWRVAVRLIARGLAQSRGAGGDSPDPRIVELAGLLAALSFVVHPLQTQSVTYVVQRMNAMAATGQLLALLLYIDARSARGGVGQGLRLAAAVVVWLLGLGAKESAAIAPVAIWLYEWYFERDLARGFARQTVAGIVLVGIPTAIAGFVVLAMSGYDPLETYPDKDFTIGERLLSEPRVLFFYASEILLPLPSRMSLLHTVEVSRSPFTPWTTLPAIVGVFAALAVCAATARRHRLLSFCGAWFFLQLLIESTVVPLALAMEHRLYLPLLGPCLAVAYVVADRVDRGQWRVVPVTAVALVVVSLLLAGTHVRNRAWATPETLWRDVLDKYPEDFVALVNLGFYLDGEGRHAEALDVYLRARDVEPADTRLETNIGNSLGALGRRGEAIAALERAIELDSDNPIAPGALGAQLMLAGRVEEATAVFERWTRTHGHAQSWIDLGRARLVAGNANGATAAFRRAARIAPHSPLPEVSLGLAAQRLGQSDRALGHFERAAALESTAEIHTHLGLALWPDRDPARAIAQLERANALAPGWPVARNNLAWMLATAEDPSLRDPARALSLARKLAEDTRGGDPEVLSTLAAALTANDRHAEARQVSERAVAVARAAGRDELAERIAANRLGEDASGSATPGAP